MTLRELWLRLTYPFRRRAHDRELREEMELHLAMRAEQLARDGFSSSDAAVEARRVFGNAPRIQSASRDAWGWHWLDGFGQDIRYVLRQIRRTPGFAFVSILTMAIGVAVNAAAFTFYDGIVLKPLPVRDPASMVRITEVGRPSAAEELSFVVYDRLRRNARTLTSVVTSTSPQSFVATLPGGSPDNGRIVSGRFVSLDFFRTLGVRASVGRVIDADDDRVVVLDHEFWAHALNADTSVLGRSIDLHGIKLTIVGVAARGFAGTGDPAFAPDMWIPVSVLPSVIPGDWQHDGRPHWQVLARLAAGATLTEVGAELGVMAPAFPDTLGKPVQVAAKHATFFQADAGEFEVFQQASAAFMVALALILGIAVVNLVNLFAARNAAREREITVRLAMGASRARIVRQLASESLVLAALGGALGLVMSRWFTVWLRNWLVGTMASVTGGLAGLFVDIGVDWRVALYAALLSAAIGLAVGVWPAVRAARGDMNTVLRQGSTSTAGAQAWANRNLLLAIQIAACLVLLTAAGTLLGGLRSSRVIDPGFDADHMLVVMVDDASELPSARAGTRDEVGRRLAILPGVRSVAWSRRVPFAGTHLRTATSAHGRVTISIDNIGATYFDAMGVPITRGRAFTATEVDANAPVMLVSQSLARMRWPSENPIGTIIDPKDVLAGPDTTQSYTIVGIVPDVRTNFLSRANMPSVYYPHSVHGDFGAFLIRTQAAPATEMNAVRLAIAGVSPMLAAETHVITMHNGPMYVQRLMAQLPAAVALVLALAGLALATLGVYGLIAQMVTRRTREIGVHIALGARSEQVIALVVRKTLRPVMWGSVAGVTGAIGVCLLLRSIISAPDAPDLTFGAGAFNPVVFAGVIATLAIVVAAACYVPARRAVAVDPTVALRAE